MMDDLYNFSDKQALTNVATSAAQKSTNVNYEGRTAKNAFGVAINEEITGYFNFSVTTALVGASAAMTVSLVTKADASISSGATVIASMTVPALSAAGYQQSVKVESKARLAYLGVIFQGSGAKVTSATVNAWLGLKPPKTDD
jgi:hypothetical protein